MYADREETLRGPPGAGARGAPRPDLAERERELQEQLRRRAVESRRHDGVDSASPRSPGRHDSRTMRRRGDDPYSDARARDYGRRDALPPRDHYERDRYDDYRRDDHRRDDHRRDDYRRDSFRRDEPRRDTSRRSASPPGARGGSRADDYEARSVFCSQLPPQVGERDLGEFFEEALGKNTVAFVQLVYDYHTGNNTHTAFVELTSPELLYKANALNGHTMFGQPITVQSADGARFHATSDLYLIPKEGHARAPSPRPRSGSGHPPPPQAGTSTRLYVGNLHYDIGSEQVRAVFEPFGEIEEAEVYYDHATGKSKGFAFVQFKSADDAHRATEQLNGFELAGRQMRVSTSKARISGGGGRERGGAPLTTRFDEGGGGGVNSADKRIALMEKLARTDPQSQEPARPTSIPRATSAALLLKYMFDPAKETGDWANELRDDVRMEAEKYGPVRHVFVEKDSPDGEVYVSFDRAEHAQQARNALHGRYFGGQRIEANFVPEAFVQAKLG